MFVQLHDMLQSLEIQPGYVLLLTNGVTATMDTAMIIIQISSYVQSEGCKFTGRDRLKQVWVSF